MCLLSFLPFWYFSPLGKFSPFCGKSPPKDSFYKEADMTIKLVPGETLLTESEAADILHVSTKTLFTWRKKRLLPFHRLGDSIRFRSVDLEEFLNNTRVEPIAKGGTANENE